MNERLIAHPVVVLRVAGLPHEAGRLATGDTVNQIEAERRVAAMIEDLTARVCDALAAWVPLLYEKDTKLARALIQIKRDLFNRRVPSSSSLSAVAGELPGDLIISVEGLLALLREARAKASGIETAHGREIAAAQDHVLARFANQDLRRAIEVTNPPVCEQLSALAAGKGSISRKDRNLLIASLARYVLRAARKTSPLSSFGIVALGGWDDSPWPPGAGPALASLPQTYETGGGLRLAVLEYVFHALLARIEEMHGDTRVALNPSLRRSGSGFAWLRVVTDDIPESRTRGTRTARVQSNATAVTLLERLFSSAPEGMMPLAKLAETLTTILGLSSEQRVATMLAIAWQNGLIGPVLTAGGDTVAWSRAAAQSLASPRRERMTDALDALIEAGGRKDARGNVRTVEQRFGGLLTAADIAEPVSRFRPLLYEDCTAPTHAFSISRNALTVFEPELTTLLEAMPILTSASPLGRFRRRILAFFRERYGDGGVCDDVYGFADIFAEYMDEVSKGASSAGESIKTGTATAGDSRASGLQQIRDALLAKVVEQARNSAGELVLSCEDISAFTRIAGDAATKRAVSNSFFAQICFDEGDPLLVLNHVYSGGGGMISRFLPDDEAVIAPIRDYLRRIAEDGGYVELPGVFGFNGNLHPRLADRALTIPPFPPVTGPEPLALDKLRLRHCPIRGELVFEEGGRPISIFYLGLLTPVLMPHMHQMLQTLSFTADRMDALWHDIAERLGPRPDGAIAIPRIRIGNLVLVRRTLGVRKADLPPADLDEPAFFTRFTHWAHEKLLPRQLYFHRLWVPGFPLAPAEAAQKPTRSTRLPKPMALDRHCPLAVRLLQRSLASSDRDVLFVEALPEGENTGVLRGGAPVAAEIAFELTLKAAA